MPFLAGLFYRSINENHSNYSNMLEDVNSGVIFMRFFDSQNRLKNPSFTKEELSKFKRRDDNGNRQN